MKTGLAGVEIIPIREDWWLEWFIRVEVLLFADWGIGGGAIFEIMGVTGCCCF